MKVYKNRNVLTLTFHHNKVITFGIHCFFYFLHNRIYFHNLLIYIYIYISHQDILLTLSRHPIRSDIAIGRSFTPASSLCTELMNVCFAVRATLVFSHAGLHKKTVVYEFVLTSPEVPTISRTSSMICEIRGKWPYSCCFVVRWIHHLSNQYAASPGNSLSRRDTTIQHYWHGNTCQ